MSEPRMLALPADMVPIVYRIRVTEPAAGGAILGEATAYELPSNMPRIMFTIARAYDDYGIAVAVEYWPA